MLTLENYSGEKLKELREDLGIKQDTLARCVGTYQATISLLETGKTTYPRTKLFIALQKFFEEYSSYQKLEAARNNANLTQAQLAEEIDCEPLIINEIEKGTIERVSSKKLHKKIMHFIIKNTHKD